MVLIDINNYLFIYVHIFTSLVPQQHCTFVITDPCNSKPTATGLFQLFNMFWSYVAYFHVRCSVFGPSGPSNPDIYLRVLSWRFVAILKWKKWGGTSVGLGETALLLLHFKDRATVAVIALALIFKNVKIADFCL